MKKSIFRYLTIGTLVLLSATSCTDYLNKEPDSDVDPTVAYKDYNNFQGYIEINYNCIPHKESNMWCCTFNWGEDEIMNTGMGDAHFTRQVDLGNYRNWYENNQTYLHADNPDPTSGDKYNHSLEHAWYCIRVCNMGLENINLMVQATPEERNVVKGQLLFFRAWWHQELMNYFGGIPYVSETFPADGNPQPSRDDFKVCARKAADDFLAAAELLPADWDKTTVGKKTIGANDLRITKATALAYAGKTLLAAASPLHVHGAEVGASKNGHTYDYDQALAAEAADVLAKAISLVESGKTPYSLCCYDYENVYDHIPASGNENPFYEIFYTTGKNWKRPGATEAMLRGDAFGENGSNWNFTKLWGPKVNSIVEHDAVIHMPTANYVNYAYGMANGLPISDPESGFDPKHPFDGRDPRFYHDIMFDGFKFILKDPDDSDLPYQYLPLQSANGSDEKAERMRADNEGSRTGYFCQKLVPHQANKYDGMYNWGFTLQAYLPYMRVTEIYLMYAEAGAAIKGAEYTNSNCIYSAKDAINIIRTRVGAAEVAAKYAADKNKFMDEVRRERACELAFEGHRWCDLQRWLLLTEYPYNIKTSQEFRRVGDYDYAHEDPRYAEVAGWHEEVILERAFEAKHYYFPFKNDDVYLYKEFTQNPGW